MRPGWLTLFVQPGRWNVYIDREMTTENPPQDQFASEGGFLIMRSDLLPVKIILLMLLAAGGAAFAQDYYLTPNPKQPGAYYMDEAPKLGGRGVPFMPSDAQIADAAMRANPVQYQRQSGLSPVERLVDQAFQANPMLQRKSVQQPDGSVIRQPVPYSQRQTMSTDEAVALENWKLDQQRKRAEIQYLQNQAPPYVDRSTDLRNQELPRESDKGEADAMRAITDLSPGSADFEIRLESIKKRFPVALTDVPLQRAITTYEQAHEKIKAMLKKPLATGSLTSDHKISVDPSVQITIPKGTKITIWKVSENKTCEVSAGDVRFTCSINEVTVDP